MKHFALGNYFFLNKTLFYIQLGLSILFSIIAHYYFSSKVTNGIYSIIISFLIFISFNLRSTNILHQNFKKQLHLEIQSITFAMQTQLNKGLSLDQACHAVFQHPSNLKILKNDIENFMKQHASNIPRKFSEFYISLATKYRSHYLSLAAQILDLELSYTQSHASAFENTYEHFSLMERNREKIKNAIFTIFLTMDFMFLIYLIIVFIILPSLNLGDNSWWQSNSRPIEMFKSSTLFCLAYLIAILLISKKENELS